MIPEDHNHKGGGGMKKSFAKLKVLKKKIITPRISYQWMILTPYFTLESNEYQLSDSGFGMISLLRS